MFLEFTSVETVARPRKESSVIYGSLQPLLPSPLTYLCNKYMLLLKLMENRHRSRKVRVRQPFRNLQLNEVSTFYVEPFPSYGLHSSLVKVNMRTADSLPSSRTQCNNYGMNLEGKKSSVICYWYIEMSTSRDNEVSARGSSSEPGKKLHPVPEPEVPPILFYASRIRKRSARQHVWKSASVVFKPPLKP